MAGRGPSRAPTTLTSLQHLVRQLLLASVAPNTRVAYRSALLRFGNFVHQFFPATPVIPSNTQVLATFIAFLYAQGYAPSTITAHITAVAFIHKLSGGPDPTERFIIRKLLGGSRHLAAQADTRKPILKSTLHSLVDSLKHVQSSTFTQQTMSAIYLLLFHAFLRIGEVITSPNNADKVIQLRDLEFQYSGSTLTAVVLTIRNYKHQKTPHPVSLSIQLVGGPYCPVQALWTYCKLRGPQPGPLFVFPPQQSIPRSWFDLGFQRSLAYIGLDKRWYKPHSFRIGAATHAAMLGASDAQIQAMGRWSTNAFRKYIRIPMLTAT